MALSMHYNFNKALCMAFSLGLMVSVLVVLEVLPVMDTSSGLLSKRHPSFPYAVPIVVGSFHFFLHVVHELLPTDPTMVFLDKSCIHQTDAERKMRGVSNLGVTCFFSWKLVVLDCDDYLERLWTVYELSSFVLRPHCQYIFLPVKLPLTVCVMSMVIAVFLFIHELGKNVVVYEFEPMVSDLSLPLLLVLPMICSNATVQRMWAREQSRRLSRLDNFSITSAKCSSEDDRAPVEENIALLLKDTGHTRDGKSGDDILGAFDHIVREQLPQVMEDRAVHP